MEFKYLQNGQEQIVREDSTRIVKSEAKTRSLRYRLGMKEIRDALAHPVYC
jgi:hypothetical protein